MLSLMKRLISLPLQAFMQRVAYYFFILKEVYVV